MIYTTSSQYRTCTTIVNGGFGRHYTNVGCTFHKNRIGGEQSVIFKNDRFKLLEECLQFLQPTMGQISRCPTWRQIAISQTSATGFFKQIKNLFAFPKGIQKRAERA